VRAQLNLYSISFFPLLNNLSTNNDKVDQYKEMLSALKFLYVFSVFSTHRGKLETMKEKKNSRKEGKILLRTSKTIRKSIESQECLPSQHVSRFLP